MVAALPLIYEVVVTAGGRVEALTVEAGDTRAARRRALEACPWADARRHFVALGIRRLVGIGARRTSRRHATDLALSPDGRAS